MARDNIKENITHNNHSTAATLKISYGTLKCSLLEKITHFIPDKQTSHARAPTTANRSSPGGLNFVHGNGYLWVFNLDIA